MKLSRLRICQVIVAYLVTAVAVAAADDKRDAVSPRAAEMRDQWILDGEAQLVVQGERELKVTATAPMALWCPEVFVGRVTVEFECMVPQPQTKLLVLLHGHGADGAAICDWKRDGTYDDYNASRMELYTIGINRGPHTSDKPDDRLANVRRIGGKECSIYTAANFQKHNRDGRAFWNAWNTLSLIGAAQEPVSGTGKYLRHRVTVDPPHIQMEVEGVQFANLVDHRPNPLTHGSVGFRCMTKGKTFSLRNVVIEGRTQTGR